MSARRVVGLDLSLSSTGMSDGRRSKAVQTEPGTRLEARFAHIVQEVIDFVDDPFQGRLADVVVIESGAFSRGAQAASAEQLAGLRYLVRVSLWARHIPFALVTPTGLKAYVTGKGVATKQQMVEAVRDRYGVDLADVKVKDGRYDLADAFGLAAMGYDRLGVPLARQGPPAPHKSLLAMDWPDVPDRPT